MRRKTLRWVSLAALARRRSRLRHRRTGRERPEGRALRQEGRRHHLHEPEPVLRGLGEPVKSGLEKQGASVTVLSSVFDPAVDAQNMNRLIADKPDLIISVPASASAIVPSYIRAKAAGIPILGAIGRQSADGSEARHRRGAHRRPVARTVRRDEPRRGHDEGRLQEGQRDRAHRHRQPEQRHRSHGGVQRVHEEVPAVQDRRHRGRELGSGDVGQGRAAAALEVRLEGRHPGRLRHGRQHGHRDHPGRQAGRRHDRRRQEGPVVTGSNCLGVGINAIKAGQEYGTGTQAPQVEAALAVKVATQILNGKTRTRRCRTSRSSASPRRTWPSSRRSAPSKRHALRVYDERRTGSGGAVARIPFPF